MKHLFLILFFALYYKGVLIANDFEILATTTDKLGNLAEVRVYDPTATIDFEKYVDKDGFRYEFNVQNIKEEYDNLTLFMCTKSKGHIELIFRTKIDKNFS